nr:MAG TPA: hypothetical protein [Bacteriophage sp.]
MLRITCRSGDATQPLPGAFEKPATNWPETEHGTHVKRKPSPPLQTGKMHPVI